VFAAEFILDASVHFILKLFEFAWWQRVARKGAQRFCAVELEPGVMEVVTQRRTLAKIVNSFYRLL
jgi:hypothetical protein